MRTWKICVIATFIIVALLAASFSGNQISGSFSISGCEKTFEGETRSAATSEFSVARQGNEVFFNQSIRTYCNLLDNFNIVYKREGDVITVLEIYSASSVTRCLCDMKVSGNFSLPDEKQYIVRFVFKSVPTNEEEILGETNV